MRMLFPLAIFGLWLGFCACRGGDSAEIAEIRDALEAARADAAAARAELAALKSAGGEAKRALDSAAAELAKNLPAQVPANPVLRAQVEAARAAYEGTAPAAPAEPTEEMQVLEFGKSFVGDLEQNRLTSAYRLTSPEYQKEIDRPMFDELVEKFPRIKHLERVAFRQEKVRKTPDDKEWEYYCTAREIHEGQFSADGAGQGPRVNFALTIAKVDKGWRVTSLEIAREKTP